MRRRLSSSILVVLAVALAMSPVAPTGAAIQPPWCVTPGIPPSTPDAAENLPDGSQPSHPPGSFPHIPYYAIGCTLERIAEESDGRMTVEVIGHSALGRPLYQATINALDTRDQREAFSNWKRIRREAMDDPRDAQRFLRRVGGDVKVPIYIQAGIHGNEQEGVDAVMRVIEDLATSPYGSDPVIDETLDHAIVVVNVVQNPDGRVAGTRANGNGFDLNRDFLTQSQPETKASVAVMQEWLPPEMLDLHGYLNPLLIEATTKPHNPSIEYDLWLKWNQPRIDANETALNAAGYEVQRPINDWCEDGDLPPPSGICPGGTPPGPAVAEGWDDWGPFYTPMYAQHVGLNGSTVEMCRSEVPEDSCGGRRGAREQQEITMWSSLEFDVAERQDLLHDHLDFYRRGARDAPRPACCPPPFDVDNNWMQEYPKAYVIPLGKGQRSDPEANRLVEWLLFNGVEVEQADDDFRLGDQRFEEDSYVVWMRQVRRGLIDTALGIGLDISEDISILYAPPASWSHGYLWGADVVTVGDDQRLRVDTDRIRRPERLEGGVEGRRADAYVLEIDSPAAVRTVNALLSDGITAELATVPFGEHSAGSVLFPKSAREALDEAGEDAGLTFEGIRGPLPAREPIGRVPRIAVLTAALNQDVWSLRNLGFTAEPVSTAASGALNNPSGPNPLDNIDVVFNTAGWPSGANQGTARSRLTDFFNAGGGYLGAGSAGANFLNASGQFPGFTPTTATPGGVGQSGIFNWQNTGGAGSLIVGAYPGQDTLIMDPPTWFSAVPATASVDGRLLADTDATFASGLWLHPRASSAAGAAIIVHGNATDGVGQAARITAFSMNPLYRADPEREWPMLASAAYWADQ